VVSITAGMYVLQGDLNKLLIKIGIYSEEGIKARFSKWSFHTTLIIF